MKPKFVVTMRIVREVMTLAQLDDLVEELRQYAFPEVIEEDHGRVTAVRVTVEGDDLWDLRENVEMVKDQVDGWREMLEDAFPFPMDREHLVLEEEK